MRQILFPLLLLSAWSQHLFGQCAFNAALSAPVSLCSAQTGVFAVSVTGGTGPFSYVWDFGDGAVLFGGASESYAYSVPGNFAVSMTVTDAGGCSEILTATVAVAPPPILVVGNNGPLCAGDDLTLTALGQGPPQYEWGGPNGFSSTEGAPTLFGVDSTYSGTYRVTATWANGCTASGTTTVNISAQLFVQINGNPQVCAGGSFQGIAAANSCGQTPYSFSWNGPNGFSANSFDILLPLVSPADTGIYSVTVTDNAGATASASVNIVLSELSVSVLLAERTCGGSCTGRALVEAGGGTAPYLYVWENGAVGSLADGLCAGPNRVTVTDANGCTTLEAANIGSNPQPSIAVASTDASCAGNDGTAMVSGTDFSSVLWSTGETALTATALAPGQYAVTAVSDEGCTATAGVSIGSPFCGYTFTGRVLLDATGDCQAGVGDVLLGGRLVTVRAGTPFLSSDLGGVFTRPDGSFIFTTETTGPYGLKVWPGDRRVLPNLCDSVAVNALPGDTVDVGDLFLRADGFSDLAVTISEGLAVGGQPYSANVCVVNIGAQAASGVLDYRTTAPNILSVSVPHTVIAPGTVRWNIPFLLPGETYCATLSVQSPLAAGTYGDTATLDLLDADMSNNTAHWTYSTLPAALPGPYKQIFGSAAWSHDDNGSGTVSDCGALDDFYLNYRIGFANNTPDTVQTVEIRDTLDFARLDLGSLSLQSSGHPVDMWMEGRNVLVARFDAAGLAPTDAGHLGFTVRPAPLFFSQYGQTVYNTAHVRFLPDPATATNESVGIYDACLGFAGAPAADFNLFPNPTDGLLWLEGEFPETGSAYVRISDALGRTVHEERVVLARGHNRIAVRLEEVPNGTYWVRLIGSQGIGVRAVTVAR